MKKKNKKRGLNKKRKNYYKFNRKIEYLFQKKMMKNKYYQIHFLQEF